MSHTLHRQGSRASLENDFVLLVMPENGRNDQNSKERLLTAWDILIRHNPVNRGDSKNGSQYSLPGQDVRDLIVEKETIFAVYTTPEQVAAVLAELKQADTGLSVVVSGILDRTCACARQAGLVPHTVGQSLGVLGTTQRLPEAPVMELETMCGHGLISFRLIQSLADQVRAGRTTAEEASAKMAQCCICGVFNPVRGAEILRAMADQP